MMSNQGQVKFIQKNIFQIMLKESEALQGMAQIEELVESGGPLIHVPLQPLYLAIKQLSPDQVGPLLSRLSEEQRTAFLDIDLWNKDELDIHRFEYWLYAYRACQDEAIRHEFINSSEFALFLKGRFNIWTFDVEDPQYPDHDHYFLTEDNLLLFEFEEDCLFVDEVRQFVRELYGNLGVEKAYSYLFKIVSDSISALQEEEYRLKRIRLEDFGIVDYYDALESNNPYPSLEHIRSFLRNIKPSKGKMEGNQFGQTLFHAAIVPFAKIASSIEAELSRVESDQRLAYLQFNFIKLVNAQISIAGHWHSEPELIHQVGQLVRMKIELGLDFVSNELNQKPDVYKAFQNGSVLGFLDFSQIHKIGVSLWALNQKALKKELARYGFEEKNEGFLGQYWTNFLDDSFLAPPRLFRVDGKGEDITDLILFESWNQQTQTFITLLPFIKTFFDSFIELKEDERIQDTFYINYKIEDIDFEAIILSSLANHWLGRYHSESSGKMGLTVDEYKRFLETMLLPDGKLKKFSELQEGLKAFSTQFGFENVKGLDAYLYNILDTQISGMIVSELRDGDYGHVGGPIILNVL